jgi:hypothetical protein
MERFSLNTAKSLLGKNVNIHLKDGSVIINVQLAEIQTDELRRTTLLKCVPHRNKDAIRIPMKSVAWAESLNLNLIMSTSSEIERTYFS